MSSILQWRRLSAKSKDESIPCKASCKMDDVIDEGTNADEGFVLRGNIKEPKQDSSHETCMQQEKLQLDDVKDKRRVSRSSIDNKLHIVQSKKVQYSHLTSSRKVIPKDENDYPIVYESMKRSCRKEPAALWLAPFRVDED